MLSQRYERGSTLVTSNLPFAEWTEVLGSERLTGALLDRLTHHVHILEMNGDSFRLKHSKRKRTNPCSPPIQTRRGACAVFRYAPDDTRPANPATSRPTYWTTFAPPQWLPFTPPLTRRKCNAHIQKALRQDLRKGSFREMVGTTRFELATSPTPRVRSTRLSHVPTVLRSSRRGR